MELHDKIKQFSKRVTTMKSQISNEEATKTSLIMPFIQLLGYDVFNPEEFIPEFTADVGIKKGEKVDYAIKIDNQLVMLIEAKSVNENLDKHSSQLFRYFTATKAKFAILTNGITYKFFTDLVESNKMDPKPFMTFNLSNLKDRDIVELSKFTRDNFDVETIFNTAESLKYCTEIKTELDTEFASPSEEFVTFMIRNIYPGRKTQNIIDKFQPMVKKSLQEFVNDLISKKIESAFEKETIDVKTENSVEEVAATTELTEKNTKKIITTEEEMESYYITKSILRTDFDSSRITFKDTESYFGILVDNNTRKWICRYAFNSSQKYIIFNTSKENREKFPIDSIDEIYDYSEKLISIAKKFE